MILNSKQQTANSKQQTANTKLLLLLLILFTFYNCQKEDLTTTQNQEVLTKALYKQRTITLKDIPKIEQKVIDKLNPEVFNRTEGSNTNQAIFDTENVLEIIDTLNNANYSFQFRFPDTPLSTFYNLVVGETPTGEVLTPYVMKYKCDDASLDNYIANGLDFKYFVGAMSIHKYTDYFALGEFDRTETLCPPELDEVGDPIACAETPVGGGGGDLVSGSGAGTGNTGGTGGTGGGGSFGCIYQGVYVVGCGGDNTNTLHPYGQCGANVEGADQYDIWECYGDSTNPTSPNQGEGTGRTVNDDCPPCETNDGAVPINTIDNLIDKDALDTIEECLGYDLNSTQTNAIVGDDLETALADYISFNGCSSETAQFIEEIVEAVEDGGEYDKENRIIKDPSFVGTKADCVYNLLKSTNSNLFNNVMSAFTDDNAKFKLRLTIGDVPDAADGSTTYNEDSDVITITFPPSTNSKSSLEIAAILLHEGIHAELRRIFHGGNLGPNPMPTAQYNYLVSLWEHYIGISPASLVGNNATHTYMVYNHVQPLAQAIRQLDGNLYNLNHYMWFGWDGLSAIGKITDPPLLTDAEETNFMNLQQIPLNDSNTQSCDE